MISFSLHSFKGKAAAVPSATEVTIVELLSKDPSEVNGKAFTCAAKITEIHGKNKWYYTTCPACPSMVFESGPQWFCTAHGRTSEPKFLASIPVTIFDEGAKGLIQKSCSDIVLTDGCRNRYEIPPAVEEAKNKKKAFEIQCQHETHSPGIRCTINHVTELNKGSTPATPNLRKPSAQAPRSSSRKLNFDASALADEAEKNRETKHLRYKD